MNLFQILCFILILTGLVWFSIYVWKRRYLYRFSWKSYGPWALPLIGNLHNLPLNANDMFEYLNEYSKKYVNTFPSRFWLGNTLAVLIFKPEQMKVIYNTLFDRTGIHNSFTMDIHGNSLGSLDYEEWKPIRKLINPGLNTIAMNQFIDVINYHMVTWIKKNKDLAGTGVVDLTSELGPTFMNILYETALGVRLQTENIDKNLLLKIKRLYNITLERVHNIIYHFNPIYYRTKLGKEHLSLLKHIDILHYKIIEQKRKMIEDNKLNGKPTTAGYLDPLFRENMSDKVIRDNLTLFSFAGSDTSIVAFCFFLLNMSLNQDIQTKVHEELDAIFGDDKLRPVTAEDLSQLKYLEQCIKESLRMFPTTLANIRYVSKDIEIDGQIIPAGTNLFLMTYPLHYNPEYWPEPDKFKPERFDNKEYSTDRNMYSYQPFVSGARNCIGAKLAILALKIELAYFLRNFKVKTQQYLSHKEVKLLWKMNLYAKEGYGTELLLK